MRLTEAEIQERRKNIILVAFHLFCERGIEDVTLSEISHKAKVGEATVYRYFESKALLTLETFEKLWELLTEHANQEMKNVPGYWSMTGLEQVKIWLDSFWTFFLNKSDYILFSYEAVLYLSRHKVKLDPFRKEILLRAAQGACITALEKGKADGTILNQKNSIEIFYIIWCFIQGYIEKRAVYDFFLGEESSWEMQYETVQKGILNVLCANE